MVGRGVLLTLAAAAAALCGAGYYFSGVTPRQYLHGEKASAVLCSCFFTYRVGLPT